jgi:aspartate aminotransferase
MIEISHRAKNLKPSTTLELAAKAKALKDEGKDILSLTVGEPDWPTVDSAVAAGIAAIQAGNTKYTPASGTASLRSAIAAQFTKDYGLPCKPSEVSVASGAKYSLFAAFQILLNDNDEVVMQSPFWVSYPEMIELCGAKSLPVFLDGIAKNKEMQKAFEDSFSPKTKMFLMNSPNNPSGMSLSSDDLKFIAQTLKKHPNVVIVSDDIYGYLSFDSYRAPHILDQMPELKDRTICINGASKTYSMTGWRIGWAVGPEKLIKVMADFQSQSTGCPSSIAQAAAEAAIKSMDADLPKTKKLLLERKNIFESRLKEIPELSFESATGAFYIWLNVSKILTKMNWTSEDFCARLLESKGVVVVPGQSFGQAEYIRISYAVDEKTIQKSVDRLQSFISEL